MTNDSQAEAHAVRKTRAKIRSLEELGAIAHQARRDGQRVALCHGVFDLLHMGHVRHLEAARREGDILMVTLTADQFVNKGPGRPIFPDHMRAEMMAAIENVDWVAVNFGPSAEPVLGIIKPNVYVKGSDYENPEEDITGKISTEREVVERHGGRVVFTRDITFSSSSLINQYLDVYDPPLRACLDRLREQDAAKEIVELIERVRDYRVLLVGDAIIDEYKYVETMGKSPKENMIASRFKNKELFAGGVFAAANHVAAFCREVEVMTVLGGEDSHEDLVRRSLLPNVKLTALNRPGKPTTRKCRFVEPGYMRKLFEVYYMDDSPYEPPLVRELDDLIKARAGEFDVVIVTDFGHGLIGPSTIAQLVANARFLAVNTQTNSANAGYNLITRYPRADYICIDAPEARLAVSDKFGDLAQVVSETLPMRVPADRIIVTHGAQGCVTYNKAEGVARIPAFTKTVVDTVGAGDAFLAVTSPLIAAGGRMEHVGFIGNAVGAIKVGIVGHRRSIEKVPLLRFLNTLLK